MICPYCLGKELVFFCKGYDRLFHLSDASYSYVRCSDCKSVLRQTMPLLEEIRGYYPRAYAPYEEVPTVKQDWSFLGALPESGAVLDIGCASGASLASFLLDFPNWRVSGVDFSSEAIERAKRHLPSGSDLRSSGIEGYLAACPSASFDLVFFQHVIEHVEYPEKMLEQIQRILKPGGKLLVSIPNAGSLLMRTFRSYAYHLDAPRHLLIPSYTGMRRLAERKSLRFVCFRGQMYPSCLLKSCSYLFRDPNFFKRFRWPAAFVSKILQPFHRLLPNCFSKLDLVFTKA